MKRSSGFTAAEAIAAGAVGRRPDRSTRRPTRRARSRRRGRGPQGAARRRVGEDGGAIGVADVAGQLVAPPSVVDANDDAPRRRAEEGEQVLGHVPHEQSDVKRPVGAPQGRERGRPAVALLDHFAPRPAPSVDDQAQRVVAGPTLEERRNRRRGRAHEPPVRSRRRSRSGLPSTGIVGAWPAARIR